MKALLLVLVAFAAVFAGPTDHVVVLMMENRSFDHMLGWLKKVNPEINGLTGSEFNPMNTSDPNSQKVYVNDQAAYVDPCPDHSIPGTTLQIFGGDPSESTAYMNGFVESATKTIGINGPLDVMSGFNLDTTPVINTLALEYAVFDKWHASIPGPTMPNRQYLMSCTSHGAGNNDVLDILFGYPQKTIFKALNESGISWSVYFEEIPTALQFKDVRTHLDNFHGMSDFQAHLQAGTLSQFSVLEPIYFDIPEIFPPASDQHPAHDVVEGEKLIKWVYESLRNSSYFENTLLIITYDEHGGFYDHVPTPLTNIPNPDGINSTSPAFDFERLGVRVPTVMVSPWIKKGTVVHEPTSAPYNNSQFEHSSLYATLKKFWNLPSFLTRRDEWAGTFENVITNTMRPMSDCPQTLPNPPVTLHSRIPPTGLRPPHELHLELVELASKLVGEDGSVPPSLFTEKDAGLYVRQQVERFFGRKLNTSKKGAY